MTTFLVALVVAALGIEALLAHGRGSDGIDGRHRLFTLAGAVIAVSSRDLLWVYVGFEVGSLGTESLRRGRAAASAVALLGLVIAGFVAEGTDLALLSAGSASTAALGCVVVGLGAKWLLAWQDGTGRFAALGVAFGVLFVRIVSWAPANASALEPAVLVAGSGCMVLGSAVVVFARGSLAQGATVFGVGLAVVGTFSGAPAVPFVLMHLAATTFAVVLLGASSRGAVALSLTTLASIPPSPGFVSKFPLLSLLSETPFAVALVSMLLVGVGCARALGGALSSETPDPSRVRVGVAAAIAWIFCVFFGLVPEPMFEIASRAAAALF